MITLSAKLKKVIWLMAAGLIVAGGHVYADRPYVVLPDGSRVEGTDIRARPNGEIILTEPRGTRTFAPGRYERAYAPRPDEFGEAQQLIRNERYDQAIEILEDLVRRYRHLEWDNRSMDLIARAQMGKGDHASAVGTYERLFSNTPRMRENRDILWSYHRAMLRAGQYDELEAKMNELISDGSRADAARAQIYRGDIKASRGLYEDAVLDYMRTVVLFKEQRDSQPEALFKAGEALEQLRDNRAREMFQRVVREFPDTRYAELARRKL